MLLGQWISYPNNINKNVSFMTVKRISRSEISTAIKVYVNYDWNSWESLYFCQVKWAFFGEIEATCFYVLSQFARLWKKIFNLIKSNKMYNGIKIKWQ